MPAPTPQSPLPARAPSRPPGLAPGLRAAWLAGQRRAALHWTYAGVAAVHGACAVLVAAGPAPLALGAPVGWAHLSLLALLAVGVATRRAPGSYATVMTAGLAAPAFAYDLLLSSPGATGPAERSVRLLAAAGFSALALWRAPLGWSLPLLAAALASGFGAAVAPAPDAAVWAAAAAGAAVFGTAARGAAAYRRHLEADRELSRRLLVAPSAAMRRAEGMTAPPAALLPPTRHACVCLAVSWRGQEARGARRPASQLAMTMNSFFDLSHDLLAEWLPDGNYFTTWGAEELFIVAYAGAGGIGPTSDALVSAAAGFAAALVAEQAEFGRLHGASWELDVGIAAGEGVLGQLGPTGRPRATVVGAVATRARRLALGGELLRRRLGARDRVVFGDECLGACGASVQTLAVEEALGFGSALFYAEVQVRVAGIGYPA